jgi:hypothetical protein
VVLLQLPVVREVVVLILDKPQAVQELLVKDTQVAQVIAEVIMVAVAVAGQVLLVARVLLVVEMVV